MRMVNNDPTLDGMNVDFHDETICYVNPDFYHRITQPTGDDNADIGIHFNKDENEDGEYNGMAHWEITVNPIEWVNMQNTTDNQVTSTLWIVNRPLWDDFDNSDAYVLTYDVPPPPPIVGDSLLCPYIEAVYIVPERPDSDYDFFIDGGTIVDSTEFSVTVVWENNTQGQLTVYEYVNVNEVCRSLLGSLDVIFPNNSN